MRLKTESGFTFPEVLIALPILLLTIFAAVAGIMGSAKLNDYARAYTRGMDLCIYRLEEIRRNATLDAANFTAAMSGFDGIRFPALPLTNQTETAALYGLGLEPTRTAAHSYVTMVNPDLADVTIAVCHWEFAREVICEDKNFNGVLDAGEDENGNGRIDSPVTLRSLIARK